MDDGILTDIIAVEKEGRDHLDAERERAAAQLEHVRTRRDHAKFVRIC